LVSDLASESDIPTQHFGSPEPVRSILAVPLRLGEKVIGMISVQCYRPSAYTLEDQVLLEMLAAYAAAAIQNAYLVERLSQSEERFRRLAENAQDIIYRYEFAPQRGFTYVSPAATTITGYTPEEHYADPDLGLKIVHPEDRPLLEAYFRGEGKFREPITLRWVRKDGAILWTEQRNVPIYDQDGNLVALEGIARDVTKRKRAEQALIESEQRYRSLFESVPEIVFSLSEDGRFTALNPAFEKVTGWSCDEWLGRSFEELISPEDRAFAVQEFQHALRGETSSFSEMRIRAKNGETRVIEVLGTAQVQDGKVIGVAGFAHDITERKQAEQALRERTEELEALFSLSSALRTAQSAEDMLPMALSEMRRLLNADASAVILLDADGEHCTVALSDGLPVPHGGLRFPLEGSLSGRVLGGLQPYVTEDYATDANRATAMSATDQIGPAAFVPLLSEDNVLGTLMAARLRHPQARPFTAAEVRLLSAIGDMVGNALHRARLHDQALARLRRLQSLRAVDRAISASFDPRLTLNVLVSEAVAQLEADAAAVLLLDPHSLTLGYAAGRGFHTRAIEATRLRLGESYAGRAALERCMLHIHDLAQTEDAARARLFDREGFVSACFAPMIAKGELRGVLEVFHHKPFKASQEWLEFLDAMASQGAIALDNAWLFQNLQHSNLELGLAYDITLEGWTRALDLRDQETEGHTQRVTELVVRLARAMGLSEQEIIHIRRGAILHDIGKMGIPDRILLKPGPLTDDEWEIMRKHPIYAYELLGNVTYLRPAIEIPYCHHEKWDGSGYPRGLKGEQIPLSARLFAVVDVWDALRSDRPYRKAWSDEEALQYIREQAGKHFDPAVVEVFLRMLKEHPEDFSS
jgi:PAS domain S-box-containing protein